MCIRDREAIPTIPAAKPSIPSIKFTQLIQRSEEHTSELQSHSDLVCRLLLEKKTKNQKKA